MIRHNHFISTLIRLIIINGLLIFLSHPNYGQLIKNRYERCFDSVKNILEVNGDFSTCIFMVENTFYNDSLNYEEFTHVINYLSNYSNQYLKLQTTQKYYDNDIADYVSNYSIFTSLFDTLEIARFKDQFKLYAIPYSYTDEDPIGKKDWTNMFVTKLLSTHKGNCHSLAYLYKIIADKLNARCWLSLAPNHIYIRNFSKKIGWYNTELSSSSFPTDGWIAITGYISTDAIRSGIYMDTLSNQQSIALCVLDLAKEYEFQTHNYYDGFILKCCDLVLKYHPVNPMALLLKAETLKKFYFKQKEEKYPDANITYEEMERAYLTLAKLHYREMPEKMYQDWLNSLKQKEKYTNKKVKSIKSK